MGRPINKRHFGTPDSGLDFKCRYHHGSEADGWIVKQVGSKRFKCTNKAGNDYTCTLVDKNSGALALGEMTISVKDSADSNAISQVTKLQVEELHYLQEPKYLGILQVQAQL